MNKFLTIGFVAMVGLASLSLGAVVGFDGGTAYLADGTTVTTTNTGLWHDVVAYEEDGIRVDFVGGHGMIGNYYGSFGNPDGTVIENSVIHAHPFYDIDIVFTKMDGSTMDLNYVEMASNTEIGGWYATGDELSYITASNGHSITLNPLDWGMGYTSGGELAAGVERIWLGSEFQGITSFTLSSVNAFCFGMDNFYIDEAAPPPVTPIPAPGAILLAGIGTSCVGWLRRRRML